MKKEIDKKKIIYIKLILDISEEAGISLKESKKIVDCTLSLIKPFELDYINLKKEILSFLTINIFSLICKL